MRRARSHCDLDVYQRAYAVAMEVFRLSKGFPPEERFSMTDQARRSSRSVAANLAEAWRKRRYRASFLSKLSDAEAEAAETQVWPQFAVDCEYADRNVAADLYKRHDGVLATIVGMISHPDTWILPNRPG